MSKDELHIGDVVMVNAWWVNFQPVKCRIYSVDDADCVVLPLTGNPHSRYVKFENIIEKIPLFDWPVCPSTKE